ncbi:MAG: Ppx/GppA family phosphatase [Pseudomonadota bacterium]
MAAPSDLPGLGFDTRSFAAPGTREGRIGVVDTGSNSIRLVIFEEGSRSPATVFNEKAMCGLGASLARTGRLDPDGKARALVALRRFSAVAEHLKVATLAGVATAAIREAEDGPAFRDQVKAETGIRLGIASGSDEARLAAQGVLFGNPGAEGVVADLGGASLELCVLGGGRPGQGITLPLGPQRLEGQANPDRVMETELAAVPETIRARAGCLYLVGGAWRALARANMERSGYPLKVLHEYTIGRQEALELARWARRLSPADVMALDGVSESRGPSLPLTARLLRSLLEALQPREIVISAFGLREGVCLEAMPPRLRAKDPLLAAAEDMEQMAARAPGFGAELAYWTLKALGSRDAEETRLIKVAALLADIGWRTHPDHRVIASWEAATRSTLTDLGHYGRVFLGLALTARYRRNRRTVAQTEATALLDQAAIDRAAAVGLTLRLGCSLAASSPGVLPHCRLEDDGTALTLRLNPPVADMAGQDSEKRLAQLAKHLGRETAQTVLA